MYKFDLDRSAAAMVASLVPQPTMSLTADYDVMADSILLLGSIRPPLNEYVFILHVGADWPTPDAKTRRRFADLRESVLYKNQIFVLVSGSAMIRHVATAVNWLSPPKHGAAMTSATVEDAIAKVEERTKKKMPVLWMLHRSVYIATQTRSSRASISPGA